MEELSKYLNSLDEKEKISLEIAKKILGDSFEIEKSIGYLNWKKLNKLNVN